MRALLMGGQACVFYGAAEFSRDLDLAILLDDANLDRLRAALADLEAAPIAVPPLSAEALRRGHAVHFRCQRADVSGLRIDVMTKMRGVPPFEDLWERRTAILAEGETIDLLSLEDLVRAKKTQRDKDWPMIRRLVERSYLAAEAPIPGLTGFWLAELRSPELLIEAAERFHAAAARSGRPAVQAALRRDRTAVEACLEAEQRAEREADRLYWAPLIQELEQLRRARRDAS